jgi:acetyl esterase/lipase
MNTDVHPDREVVYKTTSHGDLKQYVFLPPGWRQTDRRPVIIFFFGGGWTGGKASQFFPQAAYLASRGMVAVSAEYRIKSLHPVTPFHCVEDGRSAIRFLRAHAAEFGVDGNRLIGAGGSAGGHVAAAAALCPGPDAPGDDRRISCRPQAFVLFNPVLDLSDDRVMQGLENKMAISPMEFLDATCPPMVAFFGTDDANWLPQGQRFIVKSRSLGNRADLWMAGGQAHAFFNRTPWREATIIKADEFLVSLGYLQGRPTLAPVAGGDLVADSMGH